MCVCARICMLGEGRDTPICLFTAARGDFAKYLIHLILSAEAMDRTCSGSSRSLEGKLTVCCSRQGQTFIYKWAKERRREFEFSTWPLQHRWSGHVGELFLQERAAPSWSRAHRWLNYSPVASALKNYRLASVSLACSHHRTSQLHVHISLLPFGAVCSGKLKQSLAELLQVSAFVKTLQFFKGGEVSPSTSHTMPATSSSSNSAN